MDVVFSRFSSLETRHFRSVWFGQRVAALRDELDRSRDLVQWQCLSSIVIMTTIAYLLVRGLDSLWAIGLIMPLIAIGSASLQHALTLYQFYIHAHAMPALCEVFGRLRYTVGEAPDLFFDQMVKGKLLPSHDQHLVEDAFVGDYRGHQLTLALVSLWSVTDDRPDLPVKWSKAVVMTIHWPKEPARLPADQLSQMIDGRHRPELIWADGYLMLAVPCSASPFDLGGLFEPPEQFLRRLERVAAMIQMPPNLIDSLLDEPCRADELIDAPVGPTA